MKELRSSSALVGSKLDIVRFTPLLLLHAETRMRSRGSPTNVPSANAV